MTAFEDFDYQLDLDIVLDQFDYAIQSVNNASRPKWKTAVSDELLKIYSGEVSIDEGLEYMRNVVDTASAAS
jgi:multiple sugar transport system substrate-binding protein